MDVNVYFVKLEVRFCDSGLVCGLIVFVLCYVLVEVGYRVFIIVVGVILGVMWFELIFVGGGV